MPKPRPLIKHLTDKEILEIAEDEIPYALEYLKGGSYDARDSAFAELIRFARAVITAAAPATPPAPEVGELATIAARLNELAHAVTEERWREFSMCVPARPLRDADLVMSRAAALLQRFSAPAPAAVPVPVAEQPWDRDGWCGKWGYCWRFDPCENGWWSYGPPVDLMNDPGGWTHMAPYDAIPLPQGGEGQP